jgi:aspartate aminotransferase-like enzyme
LRLVRDAIRPEREHALAVLFKAELFSREEIERLLDRNPASKARTAPGSETSATVMDMPIDEARGDPDNHAANFHDRRDLDGADRSSDSANLLRRRS